MSVAESSPATRRREIAVVAGILLFAALIRVPSLTQPLGPDQGIMSVIGQGILHGGLPYRDFWEMGSPAVFYTYALMFKLFGANMAAIPLTDLLVSVLTTLLIFLLAKRIWGRGAGYVSALVFAFFSNGVRWGMHSGGDIAFGTFWSIAQRETFILPLTVGGFIALLRSERAGWRVGPLFVSGFFFGLAFVFKFPALLIFIPAVAYLNWAGLSARGRQRRRILGGNLALLFGFVAALVPFVLIFAWRGALRDMADVIFGYVFSVYSQSAHNYLGIMKTGLVRTLFVAQENFILWIFAVVSGIHILRNERRRESGLVVFWGAAALLAVASHREFFGYHYLPALAPLSLLTGYGLVKALGPRLRIRQVLTAAWGKAFIILALLANLLFFVTLDYTHYTKSFYYLTGKISREEYYAFFNANPGHDYSFPADYAAARYLAQRTNPEDKIYVLGGTDAVIYFLARRPPASRFIFSWFLFSETHGRGPRAAAYREELLAALRLGSPRYIVTVHPLESYHAFAGIHDYVLQNYELEKALPDDRYVYVLRSHAAS